MENQIDLSTHKFELTKESLLDVESIELGAYTLVVAPEEGVFIQGIQLINLAEIAIHPASITPMIDVVLATLPEYPFVIKDKEIVYQVTYGDYAWYFTDYEDALALLNAIVMLKVNGLERMLKGY